MTNAFKRAFRKLPHTQKSMFKDIVNIIFTEPNIGELKTGDLSGVRIHKRWMLQYLTLLVYVYNKEQKEITLITFVVRENFNRSLKNQVLSFVD